MADTSSFFGIDYCCRCLEVFAGPASLPFFGALLNNSTLVKHGIGFFPLPRLSLLWPLLVEVHGRTFDFSDHQLEVESPERTMYPWDFRRSEDHVR